MALGLQYKMEFDPGCRLDIYSEGFVGEVTELIGSGDNPVEYESNDVDDPYVALRGAGLNVRFIATVDTPEDTLYAEDEKYFYVEFKINGVLQFKGYAIPDGVIQSFVLNEWETSFQVVDGLTMLENYAYDQSVGSSVNGKYLLKDIVCACLNPLTFPSDSVYIAADIEYQSAPVGIDIFDWVRVSNERYLQADRDTPMDCKAVLGSILEPFGLMIVQYLGHWYVFSQGGSMLQNNDPVRFFRYQVNTAAYLETVFLTPGKILAPEWAVTKDFHHVNANQELSTGRAVKLARMRYELGVEENILQNPTFLVTGGPEPDNWSVQSSPSEITFLDPGIEILDNGSSTPEIASDPGVTIDPANGGIVLTMRIFGQTGLNTIPINVFFAIQVGTNYYNISSQQWVGSLQTNMIRTDGEVPRTIEVRTSPPTAGGDLIIRLYKGVSGGVNTVLRYDKVEAGQSLDTGLKAWIYRFENPGNILEIPDAKTVFNGDGEEGLLGTLFKNDGATPTMDVNDFTWTGPPVEPDPLFPSLLELLEVTAARIGHSMRKRQYVYEGDVFGIIPYFSAIEIDGIPEKFFVTGLTINYAKGISKVRLHQLHSGTLTMSETAEGVTKEPEYENTIKPVING